MERENEVKCISTSNLTFRISKSNFMYETIKNWGLLTIVSAEHVRTSDTNDESTMDQRWTNNGSTMDKRWINDGSTMHQR